MITIFLCDDNKETIYKYRKKLTKIAEKHKIQISLSAYESGDSLIFNLSESPSAADIIYLDILMDGTNGIETAKELRKRGCKAEIIFLTTSEDYVFDAFDISPVQYLLKDNTADEKFEQVFLNAVSLVKNKSTEMFICGTESKRKAIPIQEISFFEIWKRVVTVHYGCGQTFDFYASLEQLESRLSGKNFVRTHRSYLVNMQFISKFHLQSLLLKTNEEIPIGATHVKNVKEAFSKYVTQFSII